MSPRTADPNVRTLLLERAAHLLAEGQPITSRALAAEAGTSTMAVYTHFGGMDQLLGEVRREGFERLASFLDAVPVTKDPVADLFALGWAYCLNAVSNPDMYRVMFAQTTTDMDQAAFGAATFLPVITTVERCIAGKRLNASRDAWATAVELWALTHGMVALALGGLLTPHDLLNHLEDAVSAALVGYGDRPAAVQRSARTIRRRMQRTLVIPPLPSKGATLATAVDTARRRRDSHPGRKRA